MDMNPNRVHSQSSKQKKRTYLSAILCGAVLTTSGCGIPGLRCAKPGSSAPFQYNWNNGAPFPNTNAATSSPTLTAPAADSPDDATSDAETQPEAKSPRTFASFIRAASFQRPESQGDDKPTANDNSKAIEEETTDLRRDFKQDQESEETDSSTKDADIETIAPGYGIIDTDIGLAESNNVITTLENSAQLPVAAFYNDPFLLNLITDTMTGNQELKMLGEEIRIANNEAYARSGEYLPFVTLGARAGLEKSGRHTRDGAVEDQLSVAPGKEFPDPLGDFAVGTNVSWELDIWKRLRNSQRAAAMRYLATQEGRNFVITRVVAEVAENYYMLLALDNRVEILQATIDIQQQSLKVAEAKKAAGRGTELAVQRFEAEVQKNNSQRSLIQQQIVETENRINYLAGRYPQPVERLDVEFVDLNLNTLGAGVPSELLQNRPDIREAERQVGAAGLDVQVARARFYPSLSLTAGLGWNAFSTGYLFRSPESLVYGMAGELVGPLINKRAIKADYLSANAAQLQAIYNYQQTVLEAHIEVVNQITKIENLRFSIEVKKRQLAALESSVDVAGKLFQNARAEYVEVLLAQRELMEARMELIETKQEQLSAVVNAYQALGGGGF